MKVNKMIVAFILVIVMLFAMSSVALASEPGGENKISGTLWNWDRGGVVIDVYLSYSVVVDLLNLRAEYVRLNTSTPMKILDMARFIENIPNFTIEGFVWGKIKSHVINALVEMSIAEIEAANSLRTGIIVSCSPTAYYIEVQPQSATPAPPSSPRAQISVTLSPSSGGRTAGSGSYEIGKRAQLWAYPNSGWQFDGWYEGNTRVSQNTTWSFTVERNRTFEARFRQGSSGSTPSQPALSVVSAVDGDFRVTIPANTTVYGYSSSTTTSRTMLYSPRASFTLYCTRRLTMSDGTTRYLFRSGGDTARDWYLQFTSAMSVIEESAPISTPTPTPTPPSMPNQIAWDTSSVIASATLQAGRTYEILIDGVRQVMISTNSSNERRFDYVRYGADGRAWATGENTYTNYQLNPTDGEIYRITVRSDDIRITIPSEYANSTIITETTIPALYFFTLEARQSYRITNDASYQIMIYTNSNNERRFDYVRYDANGRAWATGENTYTNYPLNPTSGERYDITVRENDIPCYVVYEQAAFLSGIPTPSGGYIR